MRSKLSPLLTVLAIVLTFSCSDDSSGGAGGGGGNPGPVRKEKISGVSQKGPFAQGATVKIYEMGSNTLLTTATISDNNGNFEIPIPNGQLTSPYVLLEVSGVYANEVSGQTTTTPITLRAVADVSLKDNVNINVLTHLEHERVLAQVQRGTPFETAKADAQRKVLTALGINPSNVKSEDMVLFGNRSSDAMLLAVSIQLQGTRSEADVSELLNSFSEQIAISGNIGQDIKTDIENSLDGVDREEVRQHIRELNPSAQLPNIDSIFSGQPNLGSVGSCVLRDPPLCGENVPENECLYEGGTFNSNAACNRTSYPYCILFEGPLISCSSNINNCPIDEEGIRTFATQTLCSDVTKGSCILTNPYTDEELYCLDISQPMCEYFYGLDGAVFKTGQCNTTQQYPCCQIDTDCDDNSCSTAYRYFDDNFSKNDCYNQNGMPTSAAICELHSF